LSARRRWPHRFDHPGTRLPHVWLERGSQRLSTLDLIDGWFVLLTGADGGRWRESAARTAASEGIELAAYSVGPDGDLHDPPNAWTRSIGVSSDGAILVRPDGFVAWRSTHLTPSDRLAQVLSHVLCRSNAPASGAIREPHTVSR
jgi:putative polyketide hydroxylase